jgi:PEP-CTERM motif
MRKFGLVVGVLAVLAFVPLTAQASSLLVDFGSTAFSSAGGVQSKTFTVNDATWCDRTPNCSITFTASALPENEYLTWTQSFLGLGGGLGVGTSSINNGSQVAFPEQIQIDFTGRVAIDSFWVNSLSPGFFGWGAEKMSYTLTNGAADITDSLTGGFLGHASVTFDPDKMVTSLLFTGVDGKGDFYLGGLDLDCVTQDSTSPVPEPASMMLLGTGLIGLAGAARRRMKK